MKSKKNKRILSVTISLILCFLFSVNCFAIEYNGTSGSGGQSTSNVSGQYSISDASDTGGICGYRFTLVNSKGGLLTGSVDMLCSGYTYNSGATGATRFVTKRPKTYWIDHIDENFVFGNNATENNTSVCHDTDAGLSFSTNAATMKTQMTNVSTLNTILTVIGSSWSSSNLPSGSKVLCEPLFMLSIKGVKYTMTITEIGKYGRSQFGDGEGTTACNNANSWGFISDYTNKYWPGRLYVSDAYCNWAAGASNPSSRQTFGNLIRCGYGVSFAYNNTNPEQTAITVRPGTSINANGDACIKIFKDAARTQEETGNLKEGVKYYTRYYYYNSASSDIKCELWYRNNITVASGADSGHFTKSFHGDTYYDGDMFTIDSSQVGCTKDYVYSTAIAKLDTGISLYAGQTDSSGSPYVDNSSADNDKSITRYYTIINPSVSQYFYDNGNSAENLVPGYQLIQNAINNKKVYSGENIKAYPSYENNSSFNANFWYTWQLVPNYVDGQNISYSSETTPSNSNPRGYKTSENHSSQTNWTASTLYLRAKNVTNTVKTLLFSTWIGEQSHLSINGDWSMMRTDEETKYTVCPTDLKATNIEYVDYETGKVVTKVKQNQKIFIKYTFENDTDTAVYAKIRGETDNKSYNLAGTILGTNSIIEQDIIIPANYKVTIDSEPFYVNAVSCNKIKSKSEIYLYDMWQDYRNKLAT